MMELTCALVLLIVGFASSSPYGYGTKGGAAAKADASAVAGAYTGVGEVPINVPSGPGFAGSFSKSYASSSSSSSASSSSSSSSFSYSGAHSAAFPGAVGGVIPGANGCGSGNCNGGAQGSVATGSQAYSGANAASLAGGLGAKIPTGSYGHKYNKEGSQANQAQNCGSEGCQGSKDSDSSNSSGAGTGSKSSSDAKAAVSAGAELLTGSDCGGSDCSNAPDANIKCSSGNCEASHAGTSSSNYGSDKKCTSGQCGSNLNADGKPSIDYSTNDIHVPLSVASNSKSNYGVSLTSNNGVGHNSNDGVNSGKSGCSNGNCGASSSTDSKPYHDLSTTSGNPTAPNYNTPAIHLTTPKLEAPCTSPNCQNVPHNSLYGSPIQNTYNSPTSSGSNLACDGGNCGYSETKAPYTSTNSNSVNQINQASSPVNGESSNFKPDYSHGSLSPYSPVKPFSTSCAPGSPGCNITPSVSRPSDCASGNCGASTSSEGYSGYTNIKPSHTHGASSSYSPAIASITACAPGTPGCSIAPSASGLSGCASGNCGPLPSSPGYGDSTNIKPSYAHGASSSYSPTIPSGPACTPGTPGCSLAQSGSSSSFPGFSGSENIKPSYVHVTLVPSGPACTPGSPGCALVPSASRPSGCVSGNCGVTPSSPGYGGSTNIKPAYGHGASSSYSPVIPSRPACAPGTSGCAVSPFDSTLSNCASGNCGASPSTPEYGDSTAIKPSYSQGNSPVINSGSTCIPGTPGCLTTPSISDPLECASGNCGSSSSTPGNSGLSNTKPNYALGTSSSYSPGIPSGPACAHGTPGCAIVSSGSPSDCASGICGLTPSSAGYVGSTNIKPSYSHGSSLPTSSVTLSSPACAPGTPGCTVTSSISPQSTGYGGSYSIKPNFSHGSSSSYTPVNPSGSVCAPGTPGCATAPFVSSSSDCASGNCGIFPSSVYNKPSSVKPSYSHGITSSYSPVNPSGPSCVPGTPGCVSAPSASSSSDCASGNCGAYPSSQGCAPGTPGCSLSGQSSAGITSSEYGALGSGSSLTQASYGSHGAASYNKPSTGLSTFPSSGSGAYAPGSVPGFLAVPSAPTGVPQTQGVQGIDSPSYNAPSSVSCKTPNCGSGLNNLGATAGAAAQGSSKEKLPLYTGGFGGPAGILKPNEFSAPSTNYGSKPTITTGPPVAKLPGLAPAPACTSGNCGQSAPASPSHGHSGSAAGAQANAGATASADAVAYSGGFGGPPGLLKPYDSGKIDNKGPTGKHLPGSSLGLHRGIAGSGIHSTYADGGSQVGVNAGAQANAAAISSSGVSGGDNKPHSNVNGGHSHAHDGAGGCGGGCGGTGGSNLGYSRSLGLSKTGILDDSTNGLAASGAVAKSVANASSDARAFGGSYSSSSATAHASAGAAIKGGYGRR